jgi:DNA-binding GntR family transcriptional regulator
VHQERIDLVRYVSLNEDFHAELVELARSPSLAREVTRVLALPFAAPTALLSSHALLAESRELLLVAQHPHRGLLDAIGSGHGTVGPARAWWSDQDHPSGAWHRCCPPA